MKTPMIFLLTWYNVSLPLLGAQPLKIPPLLSGTDFTLTMQEGTTEFIEGIQTPTYGYNGTFGGPVLEMRQGDDVTLHVVNQLADSATTHWHGFHIPAEHDGGPHSIIESGTTWSPSFRVLDSAGTMWYHPHLHMQTTEQVTMGLAGMILIRDQQERDARLPVRYGVNEFPLVLQDRTIQDDGSFAFAFLGETMLVNGTVDPYLDVPDQRVRFRILNGSSARGYMLGLADNRTFHVVGTDGGLLPRPVERSRIQVTPGERVDLLVDFSIMPDMTNWLVNYTDELDIAVPGSGQVFSDEADPDVRLLEFRIQRTRRGAARPVPENIKPDDRISESEADRTRTVTMTLDGLFGFDGQLFDMTRIDQTVLLGDTEIWELVNETDFAHPFHIHDVQFYILDRNGVPPAPHEAGRKDTALVNARETLRFITRFEDYADPDVPYMYHCHILPHEDFGMMGQFIVVDLSDNMLDFSADAGTARLNWSANLQDFHLQDSPDLVHWYDVTNNVSNVDGVNSLDEPSGGNKKMFYRLRYTD